MPQLLFGGLLATILLGFFVWSIVDAVTVAQCIKASKEGSPQCGEFSSNMAFLLNSIGGLIAATVVGALGATHSGEFPSQKLFGKNLEGIVKTIAGFMPSVYILVWILCGVAMVIYGFVLYPASDPVPPLSAQAKVWLGTAIAAVYAYFGITPDPPPTPPTPPAGGGQ
jgi:vacuolar-type H+-ATPase subunit I/STV1